MKLQQDIMESFIQNVSEFIQSTCDIEYKPHCTVAYRDLSADNFLKAWKEYKDKPFDAEFEVDAFYLLQHDTKKWNIISTYNLSQQVIAGV